jgi:phosphoglycerate dehydrogenase-like enzyme
LVTAVLPASLRPLLEPRLPGWLDARWWDDPPRLVELAPQAEIGWFDLHRKPRMLEAVARAGRLRWLNSVYAGLDFLPLAELHRRGVMLTGGSGLTSVAVSEFVIAGMLAIAKDYPAVMRAQDRREWLEAAPGMRELAGSKALLFGYGAIGQRIARQLSGFEVEVVPVSRSGRAGTIRPDAWRGRLGEFDWVILVVPGTKETEGLIGAGELSTMKRDAVLVNFARAACIDQVALIAALREERIAAALLDVTDPEPLPADHPLWEVPGVHITMHLSGRPTAATMRRAAERFLDNLERYRQGERPQPEFNPLTGY